MDSKGVMVVRVTAEEMATYKRDAHRHEMTLSGYVRHLLQLEHARSADE